MTGFGIETTVEEIANYLKDKKSRGQRVGLFLGHRAGLFSDDNHLYRTLQRLAEDRDNLAELLKPEFAASDKLPRLIQHIRGLERYSSLTRFKMCHTILVKHFSDAGVHEVLLSALPLNTCRREDKSMAHLIKLGFFDYIITTNIDSFLEDGCAQIGMKNPADYQVMIPGDESNPVVETANSKYAQVIKIFGELESRSYHIAGNKFNLEKDQKLKRLLISKMRKDIIVIGYDPIWDQPIQAAFQNASGTIFYVNEERPQKNSQLARVLERRSSEVLLGKQGIYGNFLTALSDLVGGMNLEDGSPAVSSQQAANPIRNKVFISYSHKNTEQMLRLRVHLLGYLHAEGEEEALNIEDDVWDDTKIPIGADWNKEIRKALADAKIATLLISADFLGSDFIRKQELPILLEAANSGELQLLCVLLGPCAFAYTPLSRYQVLNRDKPLTGMASYDQEVMWAQLAEQIFNALKAPISTRN